MFNKILFLIVLIFTVSFAQKRELRGAWVATVFNIDYPSSKNLTAEQQKREYISLLDELQRCGINAVFVQVRPSCDAFYPSDEPWSEWLSGAQGKYPGYDPLAFMIEEAHKRCMEFHAWVNPFRAVANVFECNISPAHISRTKPEWIVNYSKYKWLNPGIPAVRDYVTKQVMYIVNNYDIDGIHFDDYFYPHPEGKEKFNDSRTYSSYGRGINNIDDWRRNNINIFIKELNAEIKAVKPYIRFGVSPPGIWRNTDADVNGSDTRGFEAYSAIYADVRLWLKEGWIDYAAPQIYWNRDFKIASYKKLIQWWNDNSSGRDIYAGHAAYKIGANDKDGQWASPDEMPQQVRLARKLPNLKGSIFLQPARNKLSLKLQQIIQPAKL